VVSLTYVFDIDGTICSNTLGINDYIDAKPYLGRINYVNELYDEGNTIIFATARGMGRNKNNQKKAIDDFYEMTKNQLKDWNVKYHFLFLGKPSGDLYIDDKGIKDKNFFKEAK
jgi:hypothetical protein